MLTQTQSNEVTKFSKLGIYLANESAIVDTYAPFETAVGVFAADLIVLNGLTPGKNADASGTTEDKTLDKIKIATNLAFVCQKTKAYAIATGNSTLQVQMKATKSSIMAKKETDIMGYVTTIVGLVTPLLGLALFIPYGITTASLATITTWSVTYNGLIGKASVDESGNAIANDKIDAQIKKMQLVKNTMDLLLSEFMPLNPDFVAGFILNSKNSITGVHHNGVKGLITEFGTNKGVGDAVVQLMGTDKITLGDLLGNYLITIVSPKLYVISVTAFGYVPQTKVVKIEKGEIIELDFELVKIV